MSAPLALFVYARPDQTRRTVEALLNNPESARTDVFVFSDAARTPEKEYAVRQVRDYVAAVRGFRSVTIDHRSQNMGLSGSIIDGVSRILSEHQRVIVLEDDLEVSCHFLRYMNEALDRYADEQRVISVHGYVYPTEKPLPEAFFLRGADCWGWGTWRRGWLHFNPDGQELLDKLKHKKLLRAFDFNGSYNYSGMLKGQINGANDSWAVRWYASAFLADKLTLYPGRSLVNNIGNDGSGTHTKTVRAFDTQSSIRPISLDDAVIEESEEGKKAIEEFFRATRPPLYRMLAHLLPNSLEHHLGMLIQDWLPSKMVQRLSHFLRRR